MAYRIYHDKKNKDDHGTYDQNVLEADYDDIGNSEASLEEALLRICLSFEKSGLKFYKIEKVPDLKENQ